MRGPPSIRMKGAHPRDLGECRDAWLGRVDATTMAIAERLKIEIILTLDRRDFSMYRPKHCAAFRLVPDMTK